MTFKRNVLFSTLMLALINLGVSSCQTSSTAQAEQPQVQIRLPMPTSKAEVDQQIKILQQKRQVLQERYILCQDQEQRLEFRDYFGSREYANEDAILEAELKAVDQRISTLKKQRGNFP